MVTITLKLWSKESYLREHGITSEDVFKTIQNKFLATLERLIKKELKMKSHTVAEDAITSLPVGTHEKKAQKASHESDDEDDSKSDDGDDLDASTAKKNQKQTQHASYDAPDEDDEKMIADVDAVMEEPEEENESDTDDTSPTKVKETSEETETSVRNCDFVSGFEFDKSKGDCIKIHLKVSKIGHSSPSATH